jgi:hypothetical protein
MRLRTIFLALLLLAMPAFAQRKGHDPLNDDEADKLRDTAMLPNKRLKLYVEFARARMTQVDALLGNPKAKDRGTQLHDLLADFSTLVDEIGENVESYHGQHWDIRKSLKLVIEGDSEFQLELRKVSQAANSNDPDAEQFKFALKDAVESVNANADDTRHVVQEQNALAKDQKLQKEDQPPQQPK